jgi:hemolysin-activating ACP:hemolysin acyltransferase
MAGYDALLEPFRPTEWKSGESAWIIELVAPFGAAEKATLELKTKIVPGIRFRDRDASATRMEPQS